jgi:hypothetical protein
MSDEKKIKVITGEGQETFVPESIANDEPTLKRLLASFYGTDNFRIERKEENGETVLHVVKMAGTKGYTGAPLQILKELAGAENPVIVLYRELADVDITHLSPEEVPVLNQRVEEALKVGAEQYRQMLSTRARLIHSNANPTRLPITGF